MEQLENNEEVEFLFDDQKEKLTSPLLGSFLGKIAKAKIAKIKQLQKEKKEPLIKKRDEKKAIRLELRAALEKMTPITEEEEEEFNREYQELEELTEFIDTLETAIASTSLGSFTPEHIKEKLTTEYNFSEQQINEEEKVQKPKITKWTELLEKEILEPARSRQSELRTKTGDFTSRLNTFVDTNSQIEILTAEIDALRKELKEIKEEEFEKKELIKRIFHSTTRKVNQLDVFIRRVLSGTKADYSRIEGIDQGEVLTIQGLRDIKQINKLLVDIIEVSAAGETLIKNFQEQEAVLDVIKDRTSEIDEKRSNLESKIKGQDLDDYTSEDTFLVNPSFVIPIESYTDDEKEFDGQEKKEEADQETQIQVQQTEAEIKELKRQMKVINEQQRKANIRQQEEESRLEMIQRKIDENSEKYFKLLNKLNERRDPYSKEELSTFGKENTLNPFAVQIDTQYLDLIDSQRR